MNTLGKWIGQKGDRINLMMQWSVKGLRHKEWHYFEAWYVRDLSVFAVPKLAYKQWTVINRWMHEWTNEWMNLLFSYWLIDPWQINVQIPQK